MRYIQNLGIDVNFNKGWDCEEIAKYGFDDCLDSGTDLWKKEILKRRALKMLEPHKINLPETWNGCQYSVYDYNDISNFFSLEEAIEYAKTRVTKGFECIIYQAIKIVKQSEVIIQDVEV